MSRACLTCGSDFTPRHKAHTYCSRECRPIVKAPCTVCGAVVRLRGGLCPAHYQQVRKHGAVIRDGVIPLHGPRVDRPTYRTVHARLTYWRGRASEHPCADCGAPASEWAFDNAEPQWLDARSGSAYHDNLDRYRPLCRPCHEALDGASIVCTHGESAERYDWGRCKKCHRARSRAYREAR